VSKFYRVSEVMMIRQRFHGRLTTQLTSIAAFIIHEIRN
jgi:hypothetical protein